MIPKPQRKKSKKLLKQIGELPCAVSYCNQKCDAAHILGKGAGGDDVEENLISLCRRHHQLQHAHGWMEFCYRYPEVFAELTRKGWMFDGAKLRRAE